MALTFNFSAIVATIALILVFGSIYNKMRQKKDSPLYKVSQKFKRKKDEDTPQEETQYYKRLSHKGGVKW